jgi:hypothetical protein
VPRKNLNSKLFLLHGLKKQNCTLASPHSSSFLNRGPYQEKESVTIDNLLGIFFPSDKIISMSLLQLHCAICDCRLGGVQLDRDSKFAQMPTAGDEVEPGILWEALPSTVRATVEVLSLVRYCKVGVRCSAWVASIISYTLQSWNVGVFPLTKCPNWTKVLWIFVTVYPNVWKAERGRMMNMQYS